MKIKKFSPEQLQDLGFKEYRKLFKPALKELSKTCTSVETATDCLIKTDFGFSDMPGKKLGMMIVGKLTGAWMKAAKEEMKTDKKHTLIAKCYVQTSESGEYTLVVMPQKGGAKPALMQKQLMKSALRGAPFTLHFGALAQETVVEAAATTAELTEEQAKRKADMEARMKKMDEQIAKLKAQFKIS